MPKYEPAAGTMVIAALLVLAIVFAGSWISTYALGGNPWALLPWYGIAATVIVLLGVFTIFWLPRR